MKLYERIENNNFDEIDRNRAIELIEGGNGHLVYNENYFKLQKENEEKTTILLAGAEKVKQLEKENEELKEIYRSEKKMKNEYIKLYQDLLLKENVIPVQKVKDKIEELSKTKGDLATHIAVSERIRALQELLEESEV